MKIRTCQHTLLALSILAATGVEAGQIRNANQPGVIPGRYIVVFKNATGSGTQVSAQSAPANLAASLGGKYRGQVRATFQHALRAAVMDMSVDDAQRIADDPAVAYVEPDMVMRAIATQNNATWGIDRIDQVSLPLNQTYVYSTTASNVNAYIIDTGIRASHNEFSGRVGNGYDAVGDGNGTNDCQGHGTHVSGTVGGTTWGVAKGVTLHPVRVLGCDGSGTNSGVIAGMDWVAQNAVKPAVANMSLGGGASQAVDDAVARLTNAGVVVAVAAGNDSSNACNYSPARAASAITVGSTTSSDAMSSFSNYGSCVDIFAPGSSITSASYSSNTGSTVMSGTSMASPHVAGAAALYLATHPSATPAAVTTALVNAASSGKISGIPSGPNKLLYTGDGGTTPPPTDTPLTNGTPISGISGAQGEQRFYTLTVPSGATNLKFTTTGGSGDADLYVKFGSKPSTSSADCKSESGSANETCTITNIQAGTYYVLVYGYSAYSGVSLTGSYSTGGGGGGSTIAEVEPNNSRSAAQAIGASGTTVNGTMGASSDTDYFSASLSAGQTFSVTLTPNGSSDYDLYIYNSAGTQVAKSERSSGQVDSVSYSVPSSGTYYARVYYYSGLTGSNGTYTLKLNW